jgi:hypothetical protein
MLIDGYSTYNCSAAIVVSMGGSGSWNRGICIFDGIAQASYCDYSSAAVSIDLRYGAFSSMAIALPNGTPKGYIGWLDAAKLLPL